MWLLLESGTPRANIRGMYGRIGVLATDGEKVQCHVCGKWYRRLSVHVGPAHGMSADEYRAEFGLKATQGLVSPDQREFFAKNARANPEHVRRLSKKGTENFARIRAQERPANLHKHSAQERLEAEASGRYRDSRERANRRVNELRAQEASPDETPFPVVASEPNARLYQPGKTPSQFSKRISEGHGGVTLVQRHCMWCNSPYLTAKGAPRKTCSDECKIEERRARLARMTERRSKR